MGVDVAEVVGMDTVVDVEEDGAVVDDAGAMDARAVVDGAADVPPPEPEHDASAKDAETIRTAVTRGRRGFIRSPRIQ